MNWFIIFVYSIVAYAISNILVYANGPFHIFRNIRKIATKIHPQLGELFDCMICMPTWIGIILSGLNLYFLPNYGLTPFNMIATGMPWYAILIFDGSFTSGIVWLIHTVQEAIERSGENG